MGSPVAASVGTDSVGTASVATDCWIGTVGSWPMLASVVVERAAVMTDSSGVGVELTPTECRKGRISKINNPTRSPANTRSDGIQSGSLRPWGDCPISCGFRSHSCENGFGPGLSPGGVDRRSGKKRCPPGVVSKIVRHHTHGVLFHDSPCGRSHRLYVRTEQFRCKHREAMPVVKQCQAFSATKSRSLRVKCPPISERTSAEDDCGREAIVIAGGWPGANREALG